MAIRLSPISRALMFLSLGLAGSALVLSGVGCAAQPERTEIQPLAPYRAPAEIRPEITVRPMPAESAPVATVLPSTSNAVGEAAWMPSVAQRRWKYIVIHHSATPGGNAAKFDREHKAKGWDELGYHFVIDNGNGGPDGRVEVGPRWPKQKWGAHAKTPDNRYNELGIGICFVGNFQDGKPTAKQLQSAAKLVAYLMQTYKIPASNVIGHDDTKSTLCPGRNLSLAKVRALAGDVLAGRPMDDADAPIHAHVAVTEAERELLTNQ